MATEVDDLDRASRRIRIDRSSRALVGRIAGDGVRGPSSRTRVAPCLDEQRAASHADAVTLRAELMRRKSPAQRARMDELRSDPRFQAGDVDTEAEYYRIHFGTTLRNPDHLDAVIGRLRKAFTEDGIVVARAIEDRLYEDTWTREKYDLIPALRRLDIPTLIIWGDDEFVPKDVIDHIADAISGSHLVVLPNCGHFAYLEQPDETRRVISEFMNSRAR